MSGRKKVYVDEGEYRRLQQEAAKYRSMGVDISTYIARVSDQVERDISRAMQGVNQRMSTVDTIISGLSDEVRAAEKRTSAAIRETKQHGERLQRQIMEERSQRMAEIAAINDRLTTVEQQDLEARRLANDFFSNAEQLQDAVRAFPHEHYFPGRLDKYGGRLAQARLSTAQHPQSALARAQEVYTDISELRSELEIREHQREVLRNGVIAALNGLTEAVREHQLLEVAFENGELVFSSSVADRDGVERTEIAVDEWSSGELGTIETYLAEWKEQVDLDKNGEVFLSPERMQTFLEKTTPELLKGMDVAESNAFTKFGMHRKKIQTANIVAEVLMHNDYWINDGESGWVEQNVQGELAAKFVNERGDEVVLLVGDNAIEINQYEPDNQVNRTQLEQRATALLGKLRERGLKVGNPDPTETRDIGEPAERDVKKRLRPKAAPGSGSTANQPQS